MKEETQKRASNDRPIAGEKPTSGELKRHLSGYRTSALATELTPYSIETGMRLISDKRSLMQTQLGDGYGAVVEGVAEFTQTMVRHRRRPVESPQDT